LQLHIGLGATWQHGANFSCTQSLTALPQQAPAGFMKTKEQTNPNGILFSPRKVVPYLRQIGVTDQQIRMMTVENPRRFFGGVTA
jgi:predicted metal-dependent phosphotriesterase family hydrolase